MQTLSDAQNFSQTIEEEKKQGKYLLNGNLKKNEYVRSGERNSNVSKCK